MLASRGVGSRVPADAGEGEGADDDSGFGVILGGLVVLVAVGAGGRHA